MCGIAGWLRAPRPVDEVDLEKLNRMAEALHHRGPEGRGVWTSVAGDVALVHTRLAFVDLSPLGAQPMHTPDGRYSITFNGEIYNDKELRQELEGRGHVFRSQSDTEVLLKLYAENGEACLGDLDGMFAFAIYDSHTRELFCARDPLGEKPFYYVERDGLFAFASEVRALVRAPLVEDTLDLRGVGLLLRQGSIPPPYTHIRDVKFLAQGQSLRVRADDLRPIRRRYYHMPYLPERETISVAREAMESVHAALRLSVARRLRADVPVAAFLSGGLDSALVCALSVEHGARGFRAFTVTLPGQRDDESESARAIAKHLGIPWTQIPLEVDGRGDWLQDAIGAMDVPSIDGPNTWLVSRAVHETGYKAVFSGLGGDELFMGYDSFRVVPFVEPFARIFAPMRKLGRKARELGTKIPASARGGRVLDAALAGASFAAIWLARRGLYSAAEVRELLCESAYQASCEIDPFERVESLDCPPDLAPNRRVSIYELGVYMHDQLLRDTDAMSMASSLEVRLPLIGLPVVNAVGAISGRVLRGDRPKALLADIAGRYMPEDLLQRRKRGFVLNWQMLLRAGAPPDESALSGILRGGAMRRERERLIAEGHGHSRYLALLAVAAAQGRFGAPPPHSERRSGDRVSTSPS